MLLLAEHYTRTNQFIHAAKTYGDLADAALYVVKDRGLLRITALLTRVLQAIVRLHYGFLL